VQSTALIQLSVAQTYQSAQLVSWWRDLDHCPGRPSGLGNSNFYAPRRSAAISNSVSMWQGISKAPFDRDLELAVTDGDGPHALVFPCRRVLGG
jgi:hypothetical protein